MSNRHSVYSTLSAAGGGKQPSQVSTTTLLNGLHTFYTNSQPYPLESGTSLVVNTWVTASQPSADNTSSATVDKELAERAWQHASRRAEDGCVVLG